MADWSAVLDKFLADNELPVLAGAGGVSHEGALDWAEAQYTAFSERRRHEAEAQGAERYLGDLAATAKLLESAARETKSKAPAPRRRKRGER
jgi:hypothetical protein